MINNDTSYIPWVEKYRPKRLEEMSQVQNLTDLFNNVNAKTSEMTHYLFYGPPGTGKTSAILAICRQIFKHKYSERTIEFNASDDRGISAVREKITNKARIYEHEIVCDDGSVIPPYKVIILDEADSMTDEAQDALRVIIEQYSAVTRFCFICNYISKITDAIKSRCTSVYFKKLSNEAMIAKLKEISIKESMDLEDSIYQSIIDIASGDMRRAIMMLQNIKYTYNFIAYQKKSLDDLTISELKQLKSLDYNKYNDKIDVAKIYKMAGFISNEQTSEIIENVINFKNIYEISVYCKKIISMGYPVDTILLQLNKHILIHPDLTSLQKSNMLVYSGKILYRVKECANEYIQLLDYLSCLHGIIHNNPIYLKQ